MYHWLICRSACLRKKISPLSRTKKYLIFSGSSEDSGIFFSKILSTFSRNSLLGRIIFYRNGTSNKLSLLQLGVDRLIVWFPYPLFFLVGKKLSCFADKQNFLTINVYFQAILGVREIVAKSASRVKIFFIGRSRNPN